ncbi:MAG: hypothetical protein V4515_15170 [Chloroflexota bacterium]
MTTQQIQKTAAALATTLTTTLDSQSAGRLLRAPRVFTASGPYVRAPGTSTIHVRMSGGGGGSGGASAGPGVVSVSGSGASGVGLDFWVTGVAVVDGTVTIGAAGAAGAAGANPGGSGGDTLLALASVTTAKGGSGGGGGAQNGAIGMAAGGNPLAGSTAGLPAVATPGDDGFIFSASAGGLTLSSRGGGGMMGTGGFSGTAPSGFGAGGQSVQAVNANVPGVAGTAGYLEIWEFS